MRWFRRRADGPQQFRAQVSFAADPIVQLFRDGIVEQSVDGEIAAAGVGLRVGEDDLLGMPSVLVIRLGAKRCDLKFVVAVQIA